MSHFIMLICLKGGTQCGNKKRIYSGPAVEGLKRYCEGELCLQSVRIVHDPFEITVNFR